MKPKIDRDLLAVKSHFFFFFAALGPLLPQMNVFGRQLGVSPAAMGLVTAVLPLLWACAKPAFGYLVDYFPNQRKTTFMLLICVMTGSYCGLWALPAPRDEIETYVFELNNTVYVESYKHLDATEQNLLKNYTCHWNDSETDFSVHLSHSQYINTVYIDEAVTNKSCSLLQMDFGDVREGETVCEPKLDRNLICFRENLDVLLKQHGKLDHLQNSNKTTEAEPSNVTEHTLKDTNAKANQLENNSNKAKLEGDPTKENTVAKAIESGDSTTNKVVKRTIKTEENSKSSPEGNFEEKSAIEHQSQGTVAATSDDDSNFYTSAVFWWFVVLMCLGTVAFNVANCIGDAVCFDVLGPERASRYGSQRAWGTAGYGLTALLGGLAVDAVSTGRSKNFYPAFVLAIVFTVADLICCRRLKLPPLSSPGDAGAALREVLRMRKVLVFIVFAVIAGTFDSFIIYYMFWFLEELAESTGDSAQIKLIEGVVVAGQSFLGELLFFHFSGRIIRRFGYGTTMSVSLFCYGVRMLLVSFITNPWHLVLIESVMQGPTYALCYASIVGYAARVAPEGYSATVQGIVAGMDDGLGFAIGSLAGGVLYSRAGGRGAFRAMSAVAVLAAAAHLALRRFVLEREDLPQVAPEGEKMLQVQEVSPDTRIYKDTVVPLTTSHGKTDSGG